MHFDIAKINALSADVQALGEVIFDKLTNLIPAATEDGWERDDVRVSIPADQPERGLLVHIDYPNPVHSHTRLGVSRASKDVVIFPDGTTDFPGLTLRPRVVAEYRQRLLAGAGA